MAIVNMDDNFRRGNPKDRAFLDYRNSDFQRILYQILMVDKTCSLLDLAEGLGKRPDTLYAYAEGELRVHIDQAKRINRLVTLINPKEDRLIRYWNEPGYVGIRVDDSAFAEALRIVGRATSEINERLKKGEGK